MLRDLLELRTIVKFVKSSTLLAEKLDQGKLRSTMPTADLKTFSFPLQKQDGNNNYR